MSPMTFWFILASVLIALEIFTGTFYLLVFGGAAGAAGFAAMYGYPLVVQLIVAAVIGVIGLVWLRRRPKIQRPADDVLDIGQAVEVSTWLDNNTARVRYRGTEWDARLMDGETVQPKYCIIHEIRGNTLILSAKT